MPTDQPAGPTTGAQRLATSNPEPVCDGICVMAYEVIPGGGSGVAYPHLRCPKHGRPGRGEHLEVSDA